MIAVGTKSQGLLQVCEGKQKGETPEGGVPLHLRPGGSLRGKKIIVHSAEKSREH